MNASFTSGQKVSVHIQDLIDAMLTCRSDAELTSLLRDLCSEQELAMIAERWAIAKLLHMGFPYRTIGRKTGASSATISRVAHKLRAGGALKRLCMHREERMARDYNIPSPSELPFLRVVPLSART